MPDTGHSIERLTQSELFQKVSEICAVVNAVTDTRELLEVSLKLTMELFGAERGSIFILQENSNNLVLKIAQGMALKERQALVKQMGEGIVGRVAEDKKPIIVDDITRDVRFRDFKAREGYKTTSFICAPLLIKDKLIGVINITDKLSGSRFRQDELQLLDFLASQIALNFRRIELYDKLKRIAKESESLKSELGKSSQEADHLKKKVVVQEKLASIGKLAGGIAHEFNNPLDGVMRYTNLCLEQVSEEEVLYEYLKEIKSGLARMASIVKNLLACSRSATPSKERIRIDDAVEQAVALSQNGLLSKNIKLEKTCCGQSIEIRDLGVERVFANIIQNAVDAVENNGRISIRCQCRGNEVVVEVEDNGCGISEDKFQEVFEPFYTTKDIEKGCGLGLTIAHEIIKSYNGRIDIRSALKAGTTFTVTLPMD